MNIEEKYNELISKCQEKHKLLLAIANQKCDHLLALTFEEVKYYNTFKKEITKEMFCEYGKDRQDSIG